MADCLIEPGRTPVANPVSREPVIYLHGEIMAAATMGTTIRYEVVRLPDDSPYADRYSTNAIRIEAENRSRWPVTAIMPDRTVRFADGDWRALRPGTHAERTGLDDTGHVSTAVPPGGRIGVSLRTERIRHDSPIVRADCTFRLAVPWWVWAAEVPRPGGRP